MSIEDGRPPELPQDEIPETSERQSRRFDPFAAARQFERDMGYPRFRWDEPRDDQMGTFDPMAFRPRESFPHVEKGSKVAFVIVYEKKHDEEGNLIDIDVRYERPQIIEDNDLSDK